MGWGWSDLYNPIDTFKSLAGSAAGSAGGAVGVGGDRAPGAVYTGGAGAGGHLADIYAAKNGTVAPTISDQTGQPLPWQISDATRQNLLAQQGALAGKFADQSQQGYNAYGAQGQQALNGLQAIANGQNSVSALQLQQAMQSNLAQQRSLAAGASPQNSAMAARTAAIQMGRSNAGLAGQQAVAGLQERNQAQGQYGSLLQGLRGQDLSAALQSRQNAMSGYGAGMTGNPQKSWIETYGPAIAGGIGAAASDRRLKKDIKDGDDEANAAAAKLPAFAFRYKDARFGKGPQLGTMAQDLERAGLKHTVIDTPGGKVVHGAKLATANTAMIAAMGRRLAELERKKAG